MHNLFAEPVCAKRFSEHEKSGRLHSVSPANYSNDNFGCRSPAFPIPYPGDATAGDRNASRMALQQR
jgi:hypothetical protein